MRHAVSLLFFAGCVVPFAEAALCNSGFKALGGHAIYDATIALATLLDVMSASSGSEVEKERSD